MDLKLNSSLFIMFFGILFSFLLFVQVFAQTETTTTQVQTTTTTQEIIATTTAAVTTETTTQTATTFIETVFTCPSPPTLPSCPSGDRLYPTTDDKGCVIGYVCKSEEVFVCPQIYAPVCGADGLTYSNDCYAREKGVAIVHPGECTEGITITPTPAPLPEDCTKTVDEQTGSVSIVCVSRQICPTPEDLEQMRTKCAAADGTAFPYRSPDGCELLECKVGEQEIKPNPIEGFSTCPTPTQLDEHVRKCTAVGNTPAFGFEGGCKVVRCVSSEVRPICTPQPEKIFREVETSCRERGLVFIRDFDSNGCPVPRCAATDTCPRGPPPHAIETCRLQGGEFVVKQDENGCIKFATCVTRGSESEAYAEEISRVPETTELLQVALKLEQLKIEFDRLARQANDIADYWDSVGSLDAERFRRAATMFDTAADKVDEIKEKIRDRLETLTIDDMVEIKHDIRYLKNVILKDILYVMLSTSEDNERSLEISRGLGAGADFEDVEASGGRNCGTDGYCFDRAFRVCEPAVFRPEGRFGPIISIIGLEGSDCIAKAELPEGQGPPPGVVPGAEPPYEMTCRFSDYALGIRGPQDFAENCEGSMAVLMRQFGGPASTTGGQQFPPPEGGPGGCTSVKECAQYCLENYDDCATWTKQHPAYGTAPPPREELEKIVRGEYAEYERRIFEGPGGCQGEFECRQFCEQNPGECLEWCRQTGQCPAEAERFFEERVASGEVSSLPTGRFVIVTPRFPEVTCGGCFNDGLCSVAECTDCQDCGG